MDTTVSSKYQVVIPKAVRKQLGIRPGQKLQVRAGKNGQVIITKPALTTMQEYTDQYAGSLKTAGTAWGKAGMDATDWLRQQRDKDR